MENNSNKTEGKPITHISELGIDLSSVKNLDVKGVDSSPIEASAKKGAEIKIERPKDFKRTTRSTKFNFAQPSLIDLPSEGRFYNTEDENIKKGKISIFPLTIREEEILSTPRYIIDGTATIRALDNCIDSDISASDLLMYDYSYLLFYLRKISFGNEYFFNLTCHNCGHNFDHTLKISDIKFELLPKDFKEHYRIDLPVSKYTVILSMPRVRHIKEFDEIQSKVPVSKRDEYSGISDMFAVRTSAILDSDGVTVPKEDWVEFYQSVPALDRKELSKHANVESGVNSVMDEVNCPNCDTAVGGAIPVTDDFFRFGE